MQRLIETYLKIKNILGEDTEPIESVKLVETYRRFFRPEKVKVVLLAESHVFTYDADRKVPIPQRDGTPQFWKIFFSCCNFISTPDDFYPNFKEDNNKTESP